MSHTFREVEIERSVHPTLYHIEALIDSEPTGHVKSVLLDGVEQRDNRRGWSTTGRSIASKFAWALAEAC